MLKPWFYSIRKRFMLREKIAAGYLGVMTISVCGVLLGYSIGDYFEYKTIKTAAASAEVLDLLNRLQTDFLKIENSHHRLIFYYDDDLLLKKLNDLAQQQRGLEETRLALREYIAVAVGGDNSPTLARIQSFLNKNKTVLDSPPLDEDPILRSLHTHLKNDDIPKIADSHLLELSRDISNIGSLSQELQPIIQQTRVQFNGTSASIESTDLLRFQISSGFILFSLGVALFLALKLSKAMTAPLLSLSQMAQSVTTSQNFELQAPVLTADEVGDLALSINQLITSVHNLLQRLEGKTQDLNEQKVKLEKAVELIQYEKMSALSNVVAGVAHEINNPVSFIYGNIKHTNQYIADMLMLLSTYQRCYPKPTAAVQDCIEEIDLAFLTEDLPKTVQSMGIGAERIKHIVLSLRTFSRMDEAEYKTVDVHDGLDSTLVILGHRLRADTQRSAIRVVKAYGELSLVGCYAGQINQVFMNILANAIDALEDAQTPEAEIAIATAEQGSQVVITIANNGPGIPADVQSKLFDPFFTTKAVGKGTGMGMAISYQIVVDRHGGELLCESSLTGGTQFTIRLPVLAACERPKRALA